MTTAGRYDDEPAVRMIKQKGGSNVVDDCCDSDNFVAAGVGKWLYDGLFYSYSAGHCHYHCAGQSHSGAETGLTGKNVRKNVLHCSKS
jgi:hypothetical protein